MLTALFALVLRFYRLLLLVAFFLQFAKFPANRWTVLLAQWTEPLLKPVRVFLNKYMPAKVMKIDWSPLALWLVLRVVEWLL